MSTQYAIAKLQARMDADVLLQPRQDALRCKPGNKPCGKICIPQAQKCALTGEKANGKSSSGLTGKIAGAVIGTGIGVGLIAANNNYYKKRDEAQREKAEFVSNIGKDIKMPPQKKDIGKAEGQSIAQGLGKGLRSLSDRNKAETRAANEEKLKRKRRNEPEPVPSRRSSADIIGDRMKRF